MAHSRPSLFAGVVLISGATLVLAGCSPLPVGVTAVSHRDGHLVIAVMRCDDTSIKRASVTHRGPFRTDGPRTFLDDGRWTADQDDQDIVVLDTSTPGRDWSTEKQMASLDPSVSYSASAGGDFDEPMGHVDFTTADVAALEEGQWLVDDGGQEHVVRPTTTDLTALREEECRS